MTSWVKKNQNVGAKKRKSPFSFRAQPWRLASRSRASGECPPATSYLPTSTSKRVLGVPSCCALFAACVLTVSCVMCCVALSHFVSVVGPCRKQGGLDNDLAHSIEVEQRIREGAERMRRAAMGNKKVSK
jgi:hypothetical protein